MTHQSQLWPMPIVGMDPVDLACARCKWVGTGDDGLRYFLKLPSDGDNVPAAEYICSSLADAIHLAVPQFRVAILPHGEHVFASREEGGLSSPNAWFDSVANGNKIPSALASQMSGWLALDIFVNNLDRHPDNFLFREHARGQSLFGMDFSDALCVPGWPPPDKLLTCTTLHWRRRMAKAAPLDQARFLNTLAKIRAMPDSWMADTIASLPDGWLSATLSEDLRQWWTNKRHPRLRLIEQDMHDGYYI